MEDKTVAAPPEMPIQQLPQATEIMDEKRDSRLASKPAATVEVTEVPRRNGLRLEPYRSSLVKGGAVLFKFGKFIGPGALISVAYIDPDNYQTAISAGALFGYKLLFIVLVSNLIAIYLQVRLPRTMVPRCTLTDRIAGSLGQAWLSYRHGLGPNESCPPSSVDESGYLHSC